MASSQASASNNATENTARVLVLLQNTVRWHGEYRSSFDLEHKLKLNTSTSFDRDGSSISHCVVASKGNEYVATLTADLTANEIVITAYRTDETAQVWTSRIALVDRFGPFDSSRGISLNAFISYDGECAFIAYKLGYGDAHYKVTSDHGVHWNWFDPKPNYNSHGVVSANGEYIFFIRHGGAFGGGGQGEIVDAYSIRTWRRVRSWTFAFGDGQMMHDLKLIQPLAIDRPIWVAISNTICSSTRQQFQVQEFDFSFEPSRARISDDGRHMILRTRDESLLHYWDLRKPTFKPLMSIQLPDVEVGERFIHRINGQDTIVRDAIPEQVHHFRFSLACQVLTVVVANDRSVIISCFLRYNLQLLYKKVFNYSFWAGHTMLNVIVGENRGVSLLGGSPLFGDAQGLFGLVVTFLEVPGAYDDIIAVENYFDTAPIHLKTVSASGRGLGDALHRWAVSCESFERKAGQGCSLTNQEAEYQRKLEDSIFRNGYYSSLPDRIVHLLTLSYPWDSTSKILVFAVRMRYTYSILAMAIVPQTSSEPYLLRVLYTSDNLYSVSDEFETVEIYSRNQHFILHVKASKDQSGLYSGMHMPQTSTTIIGHHFLASDADYDIFIVKESTSTTMPNGFITTPNTALVFTASFAAYFPSGYMRCGRALDYGHRAPSGYTMAKVLLWLKYPHRSRRNEPFFGGGELMKCLGKDYDVVSQDRIYDDENLLFPSVLATAASIDFLSNQTVLVDDLLRHYHRSNSLIISNAQSISCALPAVCRARPLGAFSFMRHIALFNWHIADIGAIRVSHVAHEFRRRGRSTRRAEQVKPNVLSVTIPLDGFSSYDYKVHNIPGRSWDREPSQNFYDLASLTYYRDNEDFHPFLYSSPSDVRRSGPTSPFSSMIEEIFSLDDYELQFSFMQIIWFERLIFWKIDRFARKAYIIRLALPNAANAVIHLTISLLTNDGRKRTSVFVLGICQAIICTYWVVQKLRQANRTWLFFRSVFNYIDFIVISLSFVMSARCISRTIPSRTFVAYSMPILWINLVLASRVFEKMGVLMILVTEMTRGVLPFLGLLALFTIGFTFIPFFLLRGEVSNLAENPFHDFSRSLGETINFMANDFSSLDPWNGSMISIRILRSIFIVIVSILLLNSLIALLNLKVAAAEMRSKHIWVRQMAILLIEIEKGLLTDSERKDPHLFPRWFTYTVTELQKKNWQEFVDAHPLGLNYELDDKDGGEPPANPKSEPVPQPQPSASSTPTPTPQPMGEPESTTAAAATSSSAAIPPTADTDLPKSEGPTPSTVPPPIPPAQPVEQEAQSSLSFGNGLQTTDTGTTIPVKCNFCGLVGNKICTGCRKVRYCSEEHQLSDWKTHEQVCKGKAKAMGDDIKDI